MTGLAFTVILSRGISLPKTRNSLKRVIESTSDEGDLVMDYFLGSGTTTAVAHKLRKWIGVEVGDIFILWFCQG